MQVSVIIPVYNAAKFIDKCVQSVLDQRQTSEVLLIDDRSTDGSWEICEMWMKKDTRVRIFKNNGIKGAGAARNVGIRNAKCEYIAFLDADDYYLEERFDETEKILLTVSNPDGVVESAIVKCDNLRNSSVISGKFHNDEILGCNLSFKKLNVIDLLQNSTFLIQACTIKSDVLQKTMMFDESLKQTQDTDFLIRLIRNFNIFSGNNSPVVAYYFHENNTTKNFSEAAYYRHLFYRKHLRLCLKGYYPISLILYFFTRYIEYSYLVIITKPVISKKITKMIFMPIFIYYLFSRNVLLFDKNQTTHQI